VPLDPDEDVAEPRPSAESLNREVARVFEEIAQILELKGEIPFKIGAYRNAARNISMASEGVDTLFREGRLREIHGIGQAIEAKIVEYLATGQIDLRERLRREFPPGLASLLEVPGLGPGRARAIYKELKVSSVADLERAAREGRLAHVTGFGQKAVDNLLAGLARLKQRETRNLISTGWLAAHEVRSALDPKGDGDRIAVVGSVRRMQDSIGNLDLLGLANMPGDAEALVERLVSLPSVVEVSERAADHARVLLYGGLEVRLWLVPPAEWGSALVWHTGSRAHLERLVKLASERGWVLSARGLEDEATGKRLAGDTEAGVYERLGMAWVPPELREDEGEIEAAQTGSLPKLVELSDIKGDLHNHTNWTDGVATLDEMAKAAKAKGYAYMALTDHSQNLTLTRGLNPTQLAEQRALVDRLNQKLAPFTILLGTEMDILLDGQLDFGDDVLGSLDYVSASIHSGFRQGTEVMTRRIIRAISNPLVNTLNHPHGRKIRLRPGYEVDMQAVVETAGRVGCALELNATPDRLDLNGTWARRAKQAGASFTISSDAHSVRNLEFMQFGVGSARRGWLEARDVLNTRPLDELQQLLKARR
jgi:DNA polymerase (family X)